MTTKLYRARTNIGAPGKLRAKAGGKIALNDAAARELIDIDAIDPEPLGDVSADIPPVVILPLGGAPVDQAVAAVNSAAVAAGVSLTPPAEPASTPASASTPAGDAGAASAKVAPIPDHAALSAMKVAELKALAKQLGITGQDNSTKASIIAAIDAKATGTTSDAS